MAVQFALWLTDIHVHKWGCMILLGSIDPVAGYAWLVYYTTSAT